MGPIVKDVGVADDQVPELLQAHLPHSLSLLRRLQLARRVPGGVTPTAHVLLAYHADADADADADAASQPAPTRPSSFAAAYVDLSRGPETEAWLYSSALEDGSRSTDPLAPRLPPGLRSAAATGARALARADELVLALLRRVRRLEAEYPPPPDIPRHLAPGTFMLGSVNEVVRQRLLAAGVRMTPTANVPADSGWDFCGKWLFRPEALAGVATAPLAPGMRWDTIRREDVALVQSRTGIYRREATLLMLPSTAVRLEEGTPIAWAFLGLDGTLTTLHCEEPYRGRGLAKAVACRLMREHLKDYGVDGIGAADVSIGNQRSQGVCKSIGGELFGTVSWAIVDLTSVGDPL